MFKPPIRGKHPLKKKPEPLFSLEEFAGSVGNVGSLAQELKELKDEVIEVVDYKIEEVDKKVQDKIDSITSQVVENIGNEVLTHIGKVKQGNPGKNADTKAILEHLEARMPTIDEIVAKVPKVDEKAITAKILKTIPANKETLKIIQKNFKTDPMSVIEEIMKLPEGKFKLKASSIDGLSQTISAFQSQLGRGYLHGGGDTVVAGSNITITTNAQGQKVISASAAASGTVTSVSVVTANGISGSVATATTTPAITLDIDGLNANKIADGSVSSTEFQYLGNVTSDIQTQLNGKQATLTPAALTKTDDTNVTLTLGGTPATALLQATSLTLGWTGQLSLARGGTGANLSDPGANSVMVWDDTTNAIRFAALSGLTYNSGTNTLTALGGGGTPGGSDTQVQFNDGGAFGGDAGFTYNKTTDSATLTGSLTVGTSLLPDANDGAAIGTTALQFSDLFLAEGGVINWDNGDINLTQANNTLTMSGGFFKITTSTSTTGLASYPLLIEQTDVGVGGAFLVTYHNSASPAVADYVGGWDIWGKTSTAADVNYAYINAKIVSPTNASYSANLTFAVASAATITEELVLDSSSLSPVTSDGLALGTTSLQWADLFLASGGVINWANSNITLTHATGELRLSTSNLKIGGTAARATTAGTNQLVLFDGTAPVGTLANGTSLYSTSGELRVMDAGGNATLLSPHDKEGNYIHEQINYKGRYLKIDMEKLLIAINDKFGWDFVETYIIKE